MNKRLFNPILLSLFTLILFSCESDDTINDKAEFYSGKYKIISFKSSTEVDLNNDTISSKELTTEINSFDSNDLEIRSNLISFFFPKTWISFEYPNTPEGSAEFIDYGFGTDFEYENNFFSLKEKNYIEESYIDNVESNKNVTINSDLIVIDDNHFKLSILKEYYDFNSNDWVLLDIDVIYEKQ